MRRKSAVGVFMDAEQRAVKSACLSEGGIDIDRLSLKLLGKLYALTEDSISECHVLRICDEGAVVLCKKPPPLETDVVLQIDGFGCAHCVTANGVEGEVHLRFHRKGPIMKRLLADISNFVNEGLRLRQNQHMPSNSELRLSRANGEQFRCGVEDVSLRGLILRTTVRPPIGEILRVGQAHGRVTNHLDHGIAIQFLKSVPDTCVPH
jgi:hypothetical protein